jgi:3-phenylpropionate/trans-cinnamate dioxygenase ferredoxin subunit
VSAPPLSFELVARLDDIEESIPFATQLADGLRVCLTRAGDEVFAFEDRCTHRDFALSGGDVMDRCVIECPWHGARFDMRTGEVVRGPATDPLLRLAVRVEDGAVYVSRALQP